MIVTGELLLLLVVVVDASVVVIIVGGATAATASSCARSDPKLRGTKSPFAAHISFWFRLRVGIRIRFRHTSVRGRRGKSRRWRRNVKSDRKEREGESCSLNGWNGVERGWNGVGSKEGDDCWEPRRWSVVVKENQREGEGLNWYDTKNEGGWRESRKRRQRRPASK